MKKRELKNRQFSSDWCHFRAFVMRRTAANQGANVVFVTSVTVRHKTTALRDVDITRQPNGGRQVPFIAGKTSLAYVIE